MATKPDEDDPAVVAAFVAGDAGALEKIYERWSPLVYSLALRSLQRIRAAEDVTQRVFTSAWDRRAEFEPEHVQLVAWLIRISHDEIAAATPAAGAEPAGPAADPASQEHEMIERLCVTDGISHLEAPDRRVLQLALVDHLSHDEIAERTNLPPRAVRAKIHQSLMTLRDQLEVQTGAR